MKCLYQIAPNKNRTKLLYIYDINSNHLDNLQVDNEEGLEVSEIVIKAVQMIATNGKSKQEEKSKAKNMDENDIRFIVEEGRRNKKSAYESLKEKGLIKQVEKDFFKAV